MNQKTRPIQFTIHHVAAAPRDGARTADPPTTTQPQERCGGSRGRGAAARGRLGGAAAAGSSAEDREGWWTKGQADLRLVPHFPRPLVSPPCLTA